MDELLGKTPEVDTEEGQKERNQDQIEAMQAKKASSLCKSLYGKRNYSQKYDS